MNELTDPIVVTLALITGLSALFCALAGIANVIEYYRKGASHDDPTR